MKTSKVILMAMLALLFTACSDDEEDNEQLGGSALLKVNGVEWVANNTNPPLYYGDLSDTDWTKSLLVFCKFSRNDDKYFPSAIRFDISMDNRKGHGITKGMDIATSEYLFWGGGNNEYHFKTGTFGEENYITSTYGGEQKVLSGSAVIEDFKDKEFLTIVFSNFKLPIIRNSYGNAADVLTLDGKVTFKYTDMLTDVCSSW